MLDGTDNWKDCMSQQLTKRRYDIDTLRVYAFSLLILYHVGMFYVAQWNWHVKSEYQSETLQWLMLLVNQWRMPLLFVISGIASSFMFRSISPGAFALSRAVRLLIPLIFGMLVVVPPQAYYQALSNGIIEPGFINFMIRYLTMEPWPKDAFDGSEYGFTWNHLWYLPYLLFYSLLLAALLALFRGSGGESPTRWLSRIRGLWLIGLPILPLMVYGLLIFPKFPYISHALFNDWYAHAMYFTFFIYGYLLGDHHDLWQQIKRLRYLVLALAPILYGLYWVYDELLIEQPPKIQQWAQLTIIYLNRWVWLLLVLGWSFQLMNHRSRWLSYATEAVFPWYILHQTIIVVAGYELSRRALGPVLEPALLLFVTVAACLLLHEFVIQRMSILRRLFGLRPKSVRPT